MTQHMLFNSLQRLWPVWLILAVLLILAYNLLTPLNISTLSFEQHPARSYEEAIQRIEGLRGEESMDMNPLCQLEFMSHQKKVERVIVLVHGYTNCPQQFYELGLRFYALGYNVLIAPLPQHGLADRMTDAHSQMSAEGLAAYADEMVDIAQGLGEHVTMIGFSAGGITTAWAAQNRSDLDLAVIISPAFGYKQIPTLLTGTVMNIYTFLPDEFVWWDPVLQAETTPLYAYPRYSKHALVQILRLGFATQAAAERMPPAAKSMLVVLNPTDESVNNEMTIQMVGRWLAHNANLTTYEFDASLNLEHDLIDPNQPNQQIEIVYPILIDLVNQ